MPGDSDWMTLAPTAKCLHLGHAEVAELVRPRLPCTRVAGGWRLKRADYDRWIMSRRGRMTEQPVVRPLRGSLTRRRGNEQG